jgi:hypothetical protein
MLATFGDANSIGLLDLTGVIYWVLFIPDLKLKKWFCSFYTVYFSKQGLSG